MPTIIEPITYHEGWRSYLAEAVKKEVNIPVIAVGAIKRPDSADAILAEGKADFIAIGRGHLCDAEWTNKAAARREQLIVPCIGCMHCVDTIFSFRRIQCAVNARTGRELEFSGLRQDGEGRGVAVVGGGPAGMEAARVLKLRGFNPIVYEQRAEPGGELVPGCRPPDKEPIGWYRDSMIQNLKELGIQVLTGVEAEPRQIRKRDKPYAVFIAVGAKPLIPSTIPGLNQANVSTAIDILYQPESIQPDAKYVVVGGGSSGCETAELIASRGARVTIVEMLPELASRENSITRTVMLDRLRKNDNIEILTQHTLVRVEGQTVGFEGTETGAAKELRADHVVLSFGLTPMEDEVAQWREEFDRVHVVGDAVAPSTVANAVRTAFDAAYTMRVDDTWQ